MSSVALVREGQASGYFSSIRDGHGIASTYQYFVLKLHLYKAVESVQIYRNFLDEDHHYKRNLFLNNK